jgi:hypothetical protein
MKRILLFVVAGILLLIMNSCTIEELLSYNEHTSQNEQTSSAREVDPVKVKPPTGG